MLTDEEKQDIYQRICDAMADGENELSLAYLGIDQSSLKNNRQYYAATWLNEEHNLQCKQYIINKYISNEFYNIVYW